MNDASTELHAVDMPKGKHRYFLRVKQHKNSIYNMQ